MKFAILLALAQTAAAAQPIEVRSFSQLAPLDGDWKVSTDDDPRFAAPDFDDSAWRTVRAPGEEIPQSMGVSWIRFQVQLPHTDEPLTLLLPPLGNSDQLFINGRPVGGFGGNDTFVPAAAAFAVPLGSRKLTVAIRNRKDAPTPTPLLAARGAWIGASQAIAAKQRQVELEVRWRSVVHLAMMSATAMAGLFFVLLPLWRRDARDYFWCGLYLLVAMLLRPSTSALWMLESFSAPLILIKLYGLLVLVVHCWERLYHHLLGAQLSTSARKCQQGMLLLLGAALLLAPFVGAPIAQFSAPLGLLVSIVLLVVYVDLSRRSPRREETIWMHTAVALNLGGSSVNIALFSGAGPGWLPDGAELQHAAQIARGAGILLFAGVMAMVLNRRSARLQSEQQRLAQEMRAGAEMQELLLPAGNVNVPGFTIDAAYLPMSEVGGDFYWTRAEAGGALLVVVGDVSGKGLKAAMLVSVTIGMLRLQRSSSPGAILAALNDGLAGHMGGGFVTCVCARFDPGGQATIASAGHPSPYADGHEVPVAAGLPLGIAASATYDEFVTHDRRFTFISDGVVEAENAQRELFGFERAREISAKSAREIAEAAKAWGQNDDITVVTIQRIASSEVRRNA